MVTASMRLYALLSIMHKNTSLNPVQHHRTDAVMITDDTLTEHTDLQTVIKKEIRSVRLAPKFTWAAEMRAAWEFPSPGYVVSVDQKSYR